MNTGDPVFVVGVPRSGTTLLTAMLGAHSRMDCGPETQFFAHARRAELKRVLHPRHWPTPGVEFVQSLVLNRTPVHELFGIGPRDIASFLGSRKPTLQALLESLTAVRAGREGKARWIEKTPNHLLHVRQIRSLYPNACIVRILRDPRDVALSLRGVPFASKSVLANLYSWLDRDERSWRFFEADSRSITVRYEDLVTNPQVEITRVCGLLQEAFEEGMLTPQTSADAVIGAGEWWKKNVRGPIQGTRVEAWRREFSDGEQQLASILCAEPLRRYGYPGHAAPRRTFTSHPMTTEFVERNEGALIDLAVRGVRLHPCDVRRGLPQIVWGRPGQLRWSLGASTGSRLASVGPLIARMIGQRARGRAIGWIAEDSQLPLRRGLIDAVCDLAMRMTARRHTREALFDESSIAAGLGAAPDGRDGGLEVSTMPSGTTAQGRDEPDAVDTDPWDTIEPNSESDQEVPPAALGRPSVAIRERRARSTKTR